MDKTKKKKTKASVSPDDEVKIDDRSAEEKAQDKIEEKKRIAEKYMDDSMKKKMIKPYKIATGIFPEFISEALPRPIRLSSSFLFGTSGNSDIKGLPSAAIRMLELTHHQIKMIKIVFDKMDANNSGSMDVAEFIQFLEFEDTKFIRALVECCLFGTADLNGDGVLDFGEFVLAVALIATYSKDQIMYRVFTTFDIDKSGYLEQNELVDLTEAVQAMSGKDGFGAQNVGKFIRNLDRDGNGLVDFDEFVTLNVQFPMVFFPAFKLQDQMRKLTLGADRWQTKIGKWEKLEKDRATLLEKDPMSFADQIEDLGQWITRRRAEAKEAARLAEREKLGGTAFRLRKKNAEMKVLKVKPNPPKKGA